VTERIGGFIRLFGGVPRRIFSRMTKAAKAVLADALRLGPDERAELAGEVLASLDGPADENASSAWEQEISRRIQAIDSGALELESWDDVKRRIETEILGR
jgi:putative addiction module component (TIGR02574 family)